MRSYPEVRNVIRRFCRELRKFPFLFYVMHPEIIYKGILSGPFTGTKLNYKTSWNFAPYFYLGTYEKEIHWIWDYFIENTSYQKKIWIIGAAEGYYVCGIGNLDKNSIITAYELSEESRRLLALNVYLNHLSNRVKILGTCERSEFHLALINEQPSLILCDVEGYENSLFTEPEVLMMLSHTVLVIEVHPPYDLLYKIDQLKQTHAVFVINPKIRSVEDYTVSDIASANKKCEWMNEGRPFSTPWLIAFPDGWQQSMPHLYKKAITLTDSFANI